MAAAKLQELLPGRPRSPTRARTSRNIALLGRHRASLSYLVVVAARPAGSSTCMVVLALAVRLPPGHPDRRGGHAGRHRAAQLLRRPRRRRHGLRADEQDPDHHRLARRHLGLPAVAAHVPGHEPLGDERAVRRVRQGRAERRERPAAEAKGTVRSITPEEARRPVRRRAGRSSSCRATAWRWPRRSTPSAELAKLLDEARHRRQVRDPSRRRPHAGPHERPARRGQRALRSALRDGADQPLLRRGRHRPGRRAPTT